MQGAQQKMNTILRRNLSHSDLSAYTRTFCDSHGVIF
jgi:hypothetical protein